VKILQNDSSDYERNFSLAGFLHSNSPASQHLSAQLSFHRSYAGPTRGQYEYLSEAGNLAEALLFQDWQGVKHRFATIAGVKFLQGWNSLVIVVSNRGGTFRCESLQVMPRGPSIPLRFAQDDKLHYASFVILTPPVWL